MRKIVVSCKCQTAGVAQALADFLPADEVLARPLPQAGADEELPVLAEILSADVWVHSDAQEFAARHGLQDALGARSCEVPQIVFDAFHPDLTYIAQDALGLILPGYHSAIVTWAWQRGVAEPGVPALFTPAHFEALGYFDRWRAAVAHLAQRFAAAGWQEAFLPFLLRVQRTGAFMHSIDHPRAHVLVELGRAVAKRLGARPHDLQADVVISDAMVCDYWPLYPAVAEALGLEGGRYRWRCGGQRFTSVAEFVDHSFRLCASEAWQREPLRAGRFDFALFDRVLGPSVGLAE